MGVKVELITDPENSSRIKWVLFDLPERFGVSTSSFCLTHADSLELLCSLKGELLSFAQNHEGYMGDGSDAPGRSTDESSCL